VTGPGSGTATGPVDGFGVVGGGIVGLAVARELARRHPGARVTVLEAEDRLAAHQTGHNSGVVHAGVYYPPGSLKARLCRRGVGLLREYCAEHRLPYLELGKVVVAAHRGELAALDRLEQRARENGVPGLRRLAEPALRELEPHIDGVAALHSPSTAVTDFTAVARQLADDVLAAGGRVLTGHRVAGLRERAAGPGGGVEAAVRTVDGVRLLRFDRLVVCAGLDGDALARMAGVADGVRLVPFRGEYYRLSARGRSLVNGLVYPVPDPRYPFLGVHLTPRVDGEVLVGPNAVPATALHGYRRRDVAPADLAALATWPGTWRMAARHWRTGIHELSGSLLRSRYLARARVYLPALRPDDLLPAPAGVRAQAVGRDGALLDDFVIERSGPVLLVRNAPSPAATSSLAIAEHVVDRLAG
jgi:L-2-hydroxyglutarate oxidase LhgO